MSIMDDEARETFTPEEKKRELYERQKTMLREFLERSAISREQYEKSLGDLTTKMGYDR